MSDFMRVYEPHELGADGYPLAWHRLPEDVLHDWSSSIGESHYPPGAVMGIKHVVRAEAGHRCVRCRHPYECGVTPAEWSPCDQHCTHGLPVRFRYEGGWNEAGTLAEGDIARNIALGYQFEARWRVLTVHHLDGNKANCRWWNLAALCQRCHLTIQGKVRMERVWPWEHSEWFRPYVAGYYAATYLGEHLEPVEVMQRLDDLLALERVA